MLPAVLLAVSVQRVPRVKPGCAVLAPAREFNHFLNKATILVLDHGPTGSAGVNLQKATLLTMGEAGSITGKLAENTLFMGGEHGGRGVFMLHAIEDLEGASPVGNSGLFVGGLAAAQERVATGVNKPEDFKFFFNYIKWPPGELDQDVASGRWKAFDLPHHLLMNQDADSDPIDLWNIVRRSASATQDDDAPEDNGIDEEAGR